MVSEHVEINCVKEQWDFEQHDVFLTRKNDEQRLKDFTHNLRINDVVLIDKSKLTIITMFRDLSFFSFFFLPIAKYETEMRILWFNLTHINTLILNCATQSVTWHP